MRKRFKEILSILLLALSVAVCFSACGKNNTNTVSVNPSSTINPEASQTVQPEATMPGADAPVDTPVVSNSVATIVPKIYQEKCEIMGTELGIVLAGEFIGGFKKETGNTTTLFNYRQDIDTTAGGLKAISNGLVDMAILSRPLNSQEKALNLKEQKIGFDAVAVVVNNSNTVKDLTPEQIRKIYTGEITNWNAVGGSSAKIEVYVQTPNVAECSCTINAFNTILNLWKLKIKKDKTTEKVTLIKDAYQYPGDNGVIGIVSKQKNAIGYISFDNINDSSVYPIDVSGVEPSIDNVRAGKYPLTMPFIVVAKDDMKPEVKKFYDYVVGEKGRERVSGQGYITVN